MAVSKTLIKELRQAYLETWGREFPEPDSYLEILWLEAKAIEGYSPKAKPRGLEVRKTCLTLMRENHEFEPQPLLIN